MYAILIVVHVVISLFLIAVILLQAGKGGGLADSFGGSQMQNMFGTKSATVLTRLTAVCAIGVHRYLYCAGSYFKPSGKVYYR